MPINNLRMSGVAPDAVVQIGLLSFADADGALRWRLRSPPRLNCSLRSPCHRVFYPHMPVTKAGPATVGKATWSRK